MAYRKMCKHRRNNCWLIPLLAVWLVSSQRGFEVNGDSVDQRFELTTSRAGLRVGDSYNITCRARSAKDLADTCNGNVSTLSIVRSDKPHAKLTVHIINETAVYYEKRHAEAKAPLLYWFKCNCHGQNVANSKFAVGVPISIDNLNCSFNDLLLNATLNCSFDRQKAIDEVDPETKFQLEYAGQRYDCQKDVVNESLTRELCVVPAANFIKFQQRYQLKLHMLDMLGNQSYDFERSRAELILLPRPQALSSSRNENGTICVRWKDPQLTNHILYTMEWQLRLQSQSLADADQLQPKSNYTVTKLTETLLEICLHHIPLAYHNYTLHVQRRYEHSKARWSPSVGYSFRSAATAPKRPPLVWPDGFQLQQEQNQQQLRVFWQQLQPAEYNGPDFGYELNISDSQGQLVSQPQVEWQANMAIIRQLKKTSSGPYMLHIWSRNAEGRSPQSSKLHIPGSWEQAEQRMPSQLRLHKDKHAPSLTWDAPKHHDQLQGYMLFWCASNVTQRNRCNDTVAIGAKQLPLQPAAYVNDSRLLDDSYEWAVAARYSGSELSGGTAWLEWDRSGRSHDQLNYRTLQGIVALLVLGCCFYFGFQRYEKMKSIEVVLPEGILQDQRELKSSIVCFPRITGYTQALTSVAPIQPAVLSTEMGTEVLTKMELELELAEKSLLLPAAVTDCGQYTSMLPLKTTQLQSSGYVQLPPIRRTP
ncbi:et [Drosophila busckii]|uniref:Et n=1 Tax=Drosophila busckii TaxID=30019 RepID=A0A0M4ENI6_DROBS|nr:et [Drosophila busckii]